MRTTINIDDDAFDAAKKYAEAKSLRLGKAISELIRKGLSHRWGMRQENGISVIDLPKNSPIVTTQHILDLEDGL